jgi:hypothetical protein
MGSAVGGRLLGLVLMVVMATACGRGKPVLEYDSTVTTVETAEPVSQRGIDRGGAPPPMVRMPGEEGGVAAPAAPPPRMIPADESMLAPVAADSDVRTVPEVAPAAAVESDVQTAPDVAPAAAVESDVEPDVEARAAGQVEVAPTSAEAAHAAPTPAEAARSALPAAKPAADTAVRTTNPWQKAEPWN